MEGGYKTVKTISIHAAREGGDVIIYAIKIQDIYFNPRRP